MFCIMMDYKKVFWVRKIRKFVYQLIDLLCHRAAWVRFGQSQWISFTNFNPIEPPDWPQPTPMVKKVD